MHQRCSKSDSTHSESARISKQRVYAHKMLCSFLIIIFTEHKGKQIKLLVSIENENRSSTLQIITE
jgi:hypothetical protein